jgi:hypothetical protein
MTMDTVEFIKALGFPIFVATYLLLRLAPIMRDLQKSLTVLAIIIARCNGVDYAEVQSMVGNFSKEGEKYGNTTV